MRSLIFDEFGAPEDVLRLEERPLPEPGPGEVRIRLTHRPINPSDLLTVSGEYGRLPRLPATPGLEGTGIIDALGSDVNGWQVGQRVVPLGISGSWQEYALGNAQLLLPVPDGVSAQAAAQFLANPVTAWVMLEDELDLEEGDWVLQTAAGSTLGRILLQLAQLKGYKTINLVRRRAQVQELLDLGADVVVCTADSDDEIIAQVMEATGGKGVAGAVDAVGGRTGTLALKSLRPGGTLIVYGLLSNEPISLHGGEMLFRGTTVRGYWLTYWFRNTPSHHVQAVLMQLMQLMAGNQLVPPVEAEYDLADFKQAIAHAQTPGRSGKVLITG